MLRKISWKTLITNLYVLGVLVLIVCVFSSMSIKFIGRPNIINILRQSVPSLAGRRFGDIADDIRQYRPFGRGHCRLSSVIYALLLKTPAGYFGASIITIFLGIVMGYISVSFQ